MEKNNANVLKAGTNDDDKQLKMQAEFFANDPISLEQKIEIFPKYSSYRALGQFIHRYELFKLIMDVPGSIVECGVFTGRGLMTWAKLSALLEPNYYNRKILGVDTFAGFPNVAKEDMVDKGNTLTPGMYTGSTKENIEQAIEIYDIKRPISHIPKIELIEGDATKSIPEYISNNPHTMIALLYLDMDLYMPTKVALKHFLPLMPKGAIIAFDELNCKAFSGETTAVKEELGINNLRLKRFNFEQLVCYSIIE